NDQCPVILRRSDQPRRPALEPETIDDKKLGLGEPSDLIRTRLKDVLICVAPDEAGDSDITAPDLAHDVLEDAERDDDPDQGFRRRAAVAEPGENETQHDEVPAYIAAAHETLYHRWPVASEPSYELG